MFVVHITSTYPRWSGDAVPGFVHGLARGLVGTGLRVRVLAPATRGAAPRELLDGVDVERFRYAPRWLERIAYGDGVRANLQREPWLVLALPGLLRGLRRSLERTLVETPPDIVHAHWALPQGLVAGRVVRRGGQPPLVLSVHGGDLALPRLLAWPVRRALASAQRVLAVSPALQAKAVAAGADPDRCEVRSMGFAPCFHPPEPDLPRHSGRVAVIGRLAAGKGFEVLLEAVARVPAASLVVLGDGPLRPTLERRVRESDLAGRVELWGAASPEQVASALRGAAVAVMPSTHLEGFGLTALEAMACAAPLVATDQPSLREVVVDGENARVVPRGDVRALAAALTALLDDPGLRDRLGRAGAHAVLPRYSEATVAGQVATLYRRVVAEAGR